MQDTSKIPMELFNFKAPSELIQALKNLAFKKSSADNIMSASEYLRQVLVADPEIKKEVNRVRKGSKVK